MFCKSLFRALRGEDDECCHSWEEKLAKNGVSILSIMQQLDKMKDYLKEMGINLSGDTELKKKELEKARAHDAKPEEN